MIVTRSYVIKLEFCKLIGAFTFQYAAILLDQESVTRPFPRWEGSGNETTSTHPYGKVRLVTIDAFLGPTRQFGLCNFRNWAPKVRLALLNFGCR